MFTVNRDAPRRGVILLVVLALLAMFGLAGIGYLMVASHSKESAEIQKKVGQQTNSAEKDLHGAAMQLLVDPGTSDSVLYGHGLLQDMYGSDSVPGQVSAVHDETVAFPSPEWHATKPKRVLGGQLIEFCIYDNEPHLYVGRVLTFTTGPGKQITGRVVAYKPAGSITWPSGPQAGQQVWILQLTAEKWSLVGLDGKPGKAYIDDNAIGGTDELAELCWPNSDDLQATIYTSVGTVPNIAGDAYVINGAPFSGTGVGYDQAATTNGPWLNMLDSRQMEFALTPNATASTLAGGNYTRELVDHLTDTTQVVKVNEDHDTPDYQNMALAMMAPYQSGLAGISGGEVPIPSFHRPALINYWFRRAAADPLVIDPNLPPGTTWNDPLTTDGSFTPWIALWRPYGADHIRGNGDDAWIVDAFSFRIVEFKRKIILRPLVEDHPNFDGSNPSFDVPPLTDSEKLSRLLGSDTNADNAPDQFFWDVDANGDGIRDSIWLDLGMPVRQLPDGRKYKPLYAILCVDMDGRLNLNAHGAPVHLYEGDNTVVPPIEGFNVDTNNLVDPFYSVRAQDPEAPRLPRGSGYGPAEINLEMLFRSDITAARNPSLVGGDGRLLHLYKKLLLGVNDLNFGQLDGRYGEAYRSRLQHVLTVALDQLYISTPKPGVGHDVDLALADYLVHNDSLGINFLYDYRLDGEPRIFDYAQTLGQTPSYLSVFGTPPDLKGSLALGVNWAGQPIYRIQPDPLHLTGGNRWGAGNWDDPYEFGPTERGDAGDGTPRAKDSRFTIAELERLLRPFDVDQPQLPDRLATLTTPDPYNILGLGWNRSMLLPRRHEITTDSNDLPSPSLVLTRDLRDSNPNFRPRHVTDLLRVAGVANWQFDAQLLDKDLLSGLRMDLNRPFGNGLDDLTIDTDGDNVPDEGNGIVDDPYERFALASPALNPRLIEWLRYTNATGGSFRVPMDHDNDGLPRDALPAPDEVVDDINNDGTLQDWELDLASPQDAYGFHRQMYARHLYVLTMLLTQEDKNGILVYPQWLQPLDGMVSFDKPSARARWIAQWAVNALDFRDRDSIMTAFEFDLQPFVDNIGGGSTWDVDGDLSTDEGAFRGVVWGCERPELLINETMAMHELRTEDKDNDSSGEYATTHVPAGTDDDFDQRLKPQGSLFVELFNPWVNVGNDEPTPAEFYYTSNEIDNSRDYKAGVDLTARVYNAADNPSSPIWRLLVIRDGNADDDPPVNTGDLWGAYESKDHRGMDPDRPLDPANLDLPVDVSASMERAVYFADRSKSTAPADVTLQHWPGTNYTDQTNDGDPDWISPVIPPGGYAVIGPGLAGGSNAARTHIGLHRTQTDPLGPIEQLGDRQIVLNPLSTNTDRRVYYAENPTNEAAEAAIPFGGVRADTVPVVINDPRLSVSEPLQNPPYPAAGYDPTYGYAAPYDEPLDKTDNPDRYQNVLNVTEIGGDPVTHDAYCVVHLQRLADPTLDYDVDTNPYRTIDSMPVDLTVFNGVHTGGNADPDVTTVAGMPVKFFSRERGEVEWRKVNDSALPLDRPVLNIWQNGFTWPWGTALPQALRDNGVSPTGAFTVPIQAGDPAFVFQEDVDHSLGFLNRQFGADQRTAAGVYTGFPIPPTNAMGDYLDQPYAYPWLQWNNRPFISQMELMMVPEASSSQLLALHDAHLNTGSNNGGTPQPFQPWSLTSGWHATAPNQRDAMSPHLMDFFNSRDLPGGGIGNYPAPAEFHRVLDFVHVPSRFIGTQTLVNPLAINPPPMNPTHFLHPPFNLISNYREPGRINLNTVFSGRVWMGLMNDFPGFGRGHDIYIDPGGVNPPVITPELSFYLQRFLPSRRGYPSAAPANNHMLELNNNIPTRFARPFRSSSGKYLVPTDALFQYSGGADAEVNSTLLRQDPAVREDGLAPTSPDRPLFAVDWGVTDPAYAWNTSLTTGTNKAMLPAWPQLPTDQEEWDRYYDRIGERPNDHDRNPSFRYQALQRLGNLTTTRSNVYGVWIAVGYFEVERRPGQNVDRNVYLEGYTLGRELGGDTGEVERHRAFYIIDRSIPVAFQRGKDLNAEKTIVLKRFIE